MDNSGILYNQIGKSYNITRRADPYITQRLFELLSPKKSQLYLDIGCGTGNYTLALANKGLHFYGLEPSKEMINIACSTNSTVNWIMGSAEQIPLEDNTFSAVIATLTIHHWVAIDKALNEIFRVLQCHGDLLIFTALPEQMKGYWLNHYFPKMMNEAIKQMPSFDKIKGIGTENGLVVTKTEKYFIQPDLQDNFLNAGKHSPQIYLEEEIRKGISSFAALANLAEVQKGLTKLAKDIVTGKFNDIKQQYDNDAGDYMFIKLKKV